MKASPDPASWSSTKEYRVRRSLRSYPISVGASNSGAFVGGLRPHICQQRANMPPPSRKAWPARFRFGDSELLGLLSSNNSWNLAAIWRKVQTTMTWCKRILLTLPFAVAAVLTVLMNLADRLHLHRKHVAGYAFLFGMPWAWLLDYAPELHNRMLNQVITYAIVLWIPALLYSVCFWCVLRGLRLTAAKVAAFKLSMNSGR